jgi:hypothetical protein
MARQNLARALVCCAAVSVAAAATDMGGILGTLTGRRRMALAAADGHVDQQHGRNRQASDQPTHG